MSDEKEKASVHPAVAMNDPRGGLFIIGDSDTMPVHVDDMTDEQLASAGLPPRPSTESVSVETALIEQEQHDV